jgi:serpin B
MDSPALARPLSLARGDAALSRRALLGRAALGAAAAAGLGPRGAGAAQATPAADVPNLVAGNTAFALKLYAALRRPAAENLLFSPYSVSQALAMAYAGAGGQTATQMAEALAFDLDQQALHEAFSALTADLVARGNAEADSDFVETAGGKRIKQAARGLRIANALWGERTYPFSEAYDALIERYYGAGLHEADFVGAPEDARGQINGWVAEQTEDRIEDIVPAGAITPDTRLVLANAIWFSGDWESTFWPDATEDGDFFLLDGTSVTVPFMFQHEDLDYARGDGLQAIEFPYAGSGFAFTVLLPDEGRFEAVEAGLDANALNAAIEQLDSTEVLVHLPKFAFDYDAGLVRPLQALGMVDAFDPERADFTGMVEGTPPEPPLVIDGVLHKAYIGVDELGTEAAAATVVEAVPGAAPMEPTEPPEVRIDRPFLFAIRDARTGTLLFLGRVMDPAA